MDDDPRIESVALGTLLHRLRRTGDEALFRTSDGKVYRAEYVGEYEAEAGHAREDTP